ncbi:MAG TPA: 3-dehydroquinate synthase [Casimicrobiaceae bacterium]|nr:3-dehydroquinate synthase [Casimicrobiaceae bacterium]
MQTLTVALGERSYPIHVGEGLLGIAGEWLPQARSARVVVVTNPTVASLHLETLRAGLSRAGIGHDTVLVPDGEAHKDWSTLNAIHSRLIELGAERSTLLMALGGGVIGDLAGFAAATYRRGMPLVQLPTTLLAQVDSSVGGKTAINHPLGKNMIGAFYQPSTVVIDTATLATLPEREYAAGLGEVIKYGAACDASLFSWLESALEPLIAREANAVTQAIVASCSIKAAIVAADERETGARAVLNFGHTFGHAIEAATGYDGSWLHGEAVAAGMVFAAELSVRAARLPVSDSLRLRALVERAGLRKRAPALDAERYLTLMARDKKVEAGAMRFVLLEELGRAALHGDISRADIVATLAAHTA